MRWIKFVSDEQHAGATSKTAARTSNAVSAHEGRANGRGLLLRSVEPLASAKRRLTRPPAANLSADRLPDALNIRKKEGSTNRDE
jgi:hypothetical protein